MNFTISLLVVGADHLEWLGLGFLLDHGHPEVIPVQKSGSRTSSVISSNAISGP